MKTIGILGGIGPQATMALVQRIHHHAQRMIPGKANSGYPPLNVHYFRSPPVQVGGDMTPLIPVRPNPQFLAAAQDLGRQSDFLIMAANGPHAFQDEVQEHAGVELLSMVDLAVQEVERRGWRRVGLIGLGIPQVYLDRLQPKGIDCSLVPEPLRKRLDGAIFKLMEGAAGEAESRLAIEAIEALRAADVEGAVLACTELPLLLVEAAAAADLIDPAELLARAAVEHAIA